MSNRPRGAHLVGSVPLPSAEAVFRTASDILGDWLRRIPDGETGQRSYWVPWQAFVFEKHPAFEREPASQEQHYTADIPRAKLRPGVTRDEITFDRLGYADVAQESFAKFARLKEDGVIPGHCRFQVDLPTPIAVVRNRLERGSREAVLPAYTDAMNRELEQIVSTIPHSEFAIQWDVADEFAILDGPRGRPTEDVKTDLLDRLVALGNKVPTDVPCGFHLCYGDAGHKHFKEPDDASVLVEVGNTLADRLTRPINWLHLPVPRSRTDDAYFSPLQEWRPGNQTELYLGLIHYTDGIGGAQARITTAQKTVSDFGVATECGMGRRPPGKGGADDTLPTLLHIHAAVADPVVTLTSRHSPA